MKYRAIKDYKIIPYGTIIEPNEKGEYHYEVTEDDIVTSMVLTMDMLSNGEFFKPVNAVRVTVTEQDLDNTTRRNWRVVMNINCTEKSLLKIKKFIEEGVEDII